MKCYASIWAQIDGKNIGFILGPMEEQKVTEWAETFPKVGFAVVESFKSALDMASDWERNPVYQRLGKGAFNAR